MVQSLMMVQSLKLLRSVMMLRSLLLALVLLVMAGCALQVGPPPATEEELLSGESVLSTGVAAADQLLQQGEQARQRGDYAAAVNDFERGIRLAPRSPALYLALAKTRLAMAEYGRAGQMAQRAVSLLPAQPRSRAEQTARAEAWIVIARVREQQGDTQGAERARAEAQAGWR
ncbi:MAG: hypothetical protein CML06_11230 [Pseudomonadales bacterium]|nr:hypothetical protein [Pseudomonadales bacterium]